MRIFRQFSLRRKAIDLSNTRPDCDLHSDGELLQLSQPASVRRGWHRLGWPHHFQSSPSVLAALLFALVLLVAVPVGSAFADVGHTYNFTSDMQGWSGTGWTWYTSGGGTNCPSGSGSCIAHMGGVASTAYTVTSPALVAGSGITGLVVSGSQGGCTPTITVSSFFGSASHGSGAATIGANTFTYTLPAGAIPAQGQSYTVSITVTTGCANDVLGPITVNEVGAAPPCTGNCVTYPTLSLSTVSTNMTQFFNYLAPLLYVVGGIGLGGLIVGKARHLF